MRKKIRYDLQWSETICAEWLGKHARAAEILEQVSGLDSHKITLFLNENSEFWQIVKDTVKAIENAASDLGYDRVLDESSIFTIQMFSTIRSDTDEFDPGKLLEDLTAYKTWLKF